MNNIIRKALRQEIDRIRQLRNSLSPNCPEWSSLNSAYIHLCIADAYDFHKNPKKRYRIPKTDFHYE